MKILICSDTHGDNDSLKLLINKHPKCDLYLLAGDSEADNVDISPFISIKGNCDYMSEFPLHIILPTPYGKLLMQHRPVTDYLFLKQNEIKIVVFGHTHIRKFEILDKIYYINPGAISFARDANDGSYAILDISENKVNATFYKI